MLFFFFNTSTLILKDLDKKNITRSLGGGELGSWYSECEYILNDLTSKILIFGEESGTCLATWDAKLLFQKWKWITEQSDEVKGEMMQNEMVTNINDNERNES